MTKEVEVGDAFTGKVVKTTTFGAFVELAKGTDGLLHISNVSPGQRVDTVEDVLNKGDEIAVRVVEVDRERGRIGLRLADDPDVAGKTAEELATVGSGSRPRGGNGGAPDAAAIAADAADATVTAAASVASAAPAARATAPTAIPSATRSACSHEQHQLTTLDSGVRVVTERIDSVRSVALGLLDRDRAPRRRTMARRGCRTSSSTCCSAARRATRPSRSTRSSTASAPS